MSPASAPRPIPFWIKVSFTAFMAVMVPIYWRNYGPTNFLYFCDVALFLTLAGIWMESALLISMCCVGILLPQALWCVDYVVVLCGGTLTKMTNYMVSDSPLHLRGLSLFHGWLPFLLVFLVRRTGYDRRGFLFWTVLAWVLCLTAFFFLPGPYVGHPGDLTPKNVNFVFGMDDQQAQTWMPPALYLICWMAVLTLLVYFPTHWLLRRFVPAAKDNGQCPVARAPREVAPPLPVSE
jgi:hypothetical protein